MKLEVCRDCGAHVPSDARGCSMCARNLTAEQRLAKYLRLSIVAAIAVLLALVALFIFGRH